MSAAASRTSLGSSQAAPSGRRSGRPADPTGDSPARPRRALRGDIQALRALAVGAVVVNHLWPSRLPGGYIGVDIFFVISGFLITAHLIGELDRTGRLSLPRFYARRVKRLLPAALLVAVVSLVATLVWLPSSLWDRVSHEVFASSAYFENWLLAVSSVDYSARNEAATPVQHYWSLSVEEQFYLFWPLLLLAAWLLARKAKWRIEGRRPTLALLAGAVAVVSFAFCLWHSEVARSAAYFNTFGRVWEFMLGALVAIAAPALTRAFARRPLMELRGALQLIGYAGLAFAVLRFDTATAFPGPWALLPVACTALIIAAGPEVPAWSPARLLHWQPVQYTGDISYSLYLWHWPLIVIAPFALGRSVGLVESLALLVASVLLAAATKHGIEDPGRTRLFRDARPRRSLLAALVSILVIGALTLAVTVSTRAIQEREAERLAELTSSQCFGARALAPGAECPQPFGPAQLPAQGDHNTPWFTPAECESAPRERQILAEGEDSLVECDFGTGTASSGDDADPGDTDPESIDPGNSASSDPGVEPLDVWLIGDSHSEHWRAAVYDLARGNDWRVTATKQGGCPTVPARLESAFGEPASDEKRQSCLEWSEAVSERILEEAPDVVLVSNFSSTEWVDDGSERSQGEQFATAFDTTLGAWADAGTEVFVIHDVPTGGAALSAACVQLHGEEDAGCTAPQEEALPEDAMVTAVDLFAHPAVRSLDFTDRFCQGGVCSAVIGGLPVYYDYDHMSRSYSASLAGPLGERLSEALGIELVQPTPEEQ